MMKVYFILVLLFCGCLIIFIEIFFFNGKSDKVVIFDIDGILIFCNVCIFFERENVFECV